MNFQKQANYRARKKKVAATKDTEAKIIKKEKYRIRYLSRRTMALQSKLKDLQEKLKQEGKAIKNKEMIISNSRKLKVKLTKQLKDMKAELSNSTMFK